MANQRRAYAEQGRQKTVTTLYGNTTIVQRGVEEWVRNGQLRGDASPVSSSTTIIQRSRGIRRERARSTLSRREDTEEMEAMIMEEMTQIETRMTNLAKRGQEELKEGVEAGLPVIQTEIRMQLKQEAERESKSRAEEKTRLRKIEKG